LRLFERSTQLTISEFSPRRMVDEFLEARALKGGAKQSSVVIDAQDSCPAVVSLDQRHARAALQYSLANATAAAVGHPIRLVLRGGPDRLVIEIAIDHPAPQSVKPTMLSPRSFERLTGFAAERRGMDLAIAARVSELFGGSARLDLADGQGTVVVLDWPAILPNS
jgi:signal transduction histidine kinase